MGDAGRRCIFHWHEQNGLLVLCTDDIQHRGNPAFRIEWVIERTGRSGQSVWYRSDHATKRTNRTGRTAFPTARLLHGIARVLEQCCYNVVLFEIIDSLTEPSSLDNAGAAPHPQVLLERVLHRVPGPGGAGQVISLLLCPTTVCRLSHM